MSENQLQKDKIVDFRNLSELAEKTTTATITTNQSMDDSASHPKIASLNKKGAIMKSLPSLLGSKKNFQTNEGFTLIELLVVIAIIGLLASVVLVSLNGARVKSRDVKRKADLRQMATALELYYDANAGYPVQLSWTSSENSDAYPYSADYIPGLVVSGYIGQLPKDPIGGASHINPPCTPPHKRAYLYISDGTNYKLLAHCSPEGAISSTDSFYDPLRTQHAWMVCGGANCSTWR